MFAKLCEHCGSSFTSTHSRARFCTKVCAGVATASRVAAVSPGDRFGRLTAVEPRGRDMTGAGLGRVWLCRCDCGVERTVVVAQLRAGNVKSCGCLLAEHRARYRAVRFSWPRLNRKQRERAAARGRA